MGYRYHIRTCGNVLLHAVVYQHAHITKRNMRRWSINVYQHFSGGRSFRWIGWCCCSLIMSALVVGVAVTKYVCSARYHWKEVSIQASTNTISVIHHSLGTIRSRYEYKRADRCALCGQGWVKPSAWSYQGSATYACPYYYIENVSLYDVHTVVEQCASLIIQLG